MARANRDEYNRYMSEYMLKRYHDRRANAVEHLGGKCVRCDSTGNLEMDHVDPSTKSFDIGKMWSLSEDKFWLEVAKCQLLCRKHHTAKTLVDLQRKPARGTHGTISAVRYCKPICEECKTVKNEYNRRYKRKRRAKENSRLRDATG